MKSFAYMFAGVSGVSVVSVVSAVSAGAARAEEADAPVQFSVSYVADLIGVVEGGLERRGRFLDNINFILDADLEPLLGWRGAAVHFDVLNNSGAMPNNDAGTLQGVDNIEVSRRRVRLFTAWIEQSWGDASLLAGLYDLNSEFYANESAGLLIAPAFGIGSEIAASGPNGPSIFPSTAFGVRFQHRFANAAYVRAAILNANAGVIGDPGGVDLSFDGGALLIAEGGVEGERKIAFGVWRYTQRQGDIREFDAGGDPIQRIAHGVYAMLDQPLNDPEGTRAAHWFLRAGLSDGDTTQFSGGWQTGVLVERVFEGRPGSVFSIGVNQGVLSSGYRQNQLDLGAPMERAELQVEITYADRLAPFLTIQPDLQWTPNPGGDRSNEDVLVAGVRFSFEL